MGTPAGNLPLSRLSDEELFELLPASDEERYRPRIHPGEDELFRKEPERFVKEDARAVLIELWNRHFATVESKAKARLGRLCPHQHADKAGFVMDSLGQAYAIFLRRIARRQYESFPAYFYMLIINAGRDEARKITGIRGPAEGEHEDKVRPQSRPEPDQLDDSDDVVSPGKGPLQQVTESRLRKIIAEILREHAEDHPTSARTVRLRGAEGQTWEQVAERVFPEEFFTASLEARKGKVRRLFSDNRSKIAPKLEKFGITSEHVFHWKETSSVTAAESESE